MHVMYRDRITRMIFATVITDVVIAIIYLLTSYKYFFKKKQRNLPNKSRTGIHVCSTSALITWHEKQTCGEAFM